MGVSSLTKLLFTPDPIKKAPIVMEMLFPAAWLSEADEEDPRKTNRQVQTEVCVCVCVYVINMYILNFLLL